MQKFIIATCLGSEEECKDKNSKINDILKDSFYKYKDTVILDLRNMNSETLQKFISIGAIDCFIFSPDTLNSKETKSIVSAVFSTDIKLKKNTRFIDMYDSNNEDEKDRAIKIGDLLLDEKYSTNLTHMDINSDLELTRQNFIGAKNDSIKQRENLQEREDYIVDLAENIVSDIEINKDEYTSKHIRSVCMIAEAVARKMNLSEDDIDILKVGALLHDVGKKDVSDSVLKKPSRLTNEEFQEMKSHVSLGEVELNNFDLGDFEKAKVIAAEHHERFDGTGYPRGLKGEEIDVLSRIVSLADSTQAMFGRSYQNGRTKQDLINELNRCAGTQFDPNMVGYLCEILDKEPNSIGVSYDEQEKISYYVPTTQELLKNAKEERASKEGNTIE